MKILRFVCQFVTAAIGCACILFGALLGEALVLAVGLLLVSGSAAFVAD